MTRSISKDTRHAEYYPKSLLNNLPLLSTHSIHRLNLCHKVTEDILYDVTALSFLIGPNLDTLKVCLFGVQ